MFPLALVPVVLFAAAFWPLRVDLARGSLIVPSLCGELVTHVRYEY
jgi:hypothetical protein